MKERGKIIDISEQLPHGLEYKPEYWDAALGMIEEYEKKVLWFNRVGIAVVLFSLVCALFWNFTAEAVGMELVDFSSKSVRRKDLNRDVSRKMLASANLIEEPKVKKVPAENHGSKSSTAVYSETTTAAAQVVNPSTKWTVSNQKINDDNLNLNEGQGVALSNEEENSSLPISTEPTVEFALTLEGDYPSVLPPVHDTSKEVLELYGQDIQPIPALGLTLTTLQKTPIAKIREPWRDIEKITFHWIAGYNISSNYSSDYWKLNGISDADFSEEVGLQQLRNSRTESRGIFGFGVNYRFNSLWGLRVNLHYSAASKLNFKQAVYDTCFTLAATPELIERAMYTTKLHYLSLPIEFTYAFNAKFHLALGGGFSWLAQNDYVVERYFDGGQEVSACSLSPDLHIERRVVLEKGYLDGFRRMNFFSTVGLDYALSDKLLLGTTYQLGWSDITREGAFVSDSFDRNSRWYVHLRFNIWSK